MSASSPKSSRRSSRRARRRRRVLRIAAWAASVVFVPGAFAAGFLWRQAKMNRFMALADAPPQISEQQKIEALHLFDEAVRARHEERAQGAMNAISAARRADPQLRGVNVFVGEIALQQKDMETLQRASRNAMVERVNEASANVLSALEVWMRRGQKGVEKAGQLAEQYLSDGADAEPSNAAVYLFHGDLSRMLGEGRKAHRYLLAALYRQQPWFSASLLEIKMQLAARGAAEQGKAVLIKPPTEQAEAMMALRNAAASSAGGNEAFAQVLLVTPTLQLIAALDDLALSGSRTLIQDDSFRAAVAVGIPYVAETVPDAAK